MFTMVVSVDLDHDREPEAFSGRASLPVEDDILQK